jgi:hypothetical protein
LALAAAALVHLSAVALVLALDSMLEVVLAPAHELALQSGLAVIDPGQSLSAAS